MRIFRYIHNPLELVNKLALVQNIFPAVMASMIPSVMGGAAASVGMSAATKAALIGAAGSIGSSAVSGIMGANSARRQMSFQRDMSNTSYQRAMADMSAAGLNPMLVTKLGGASTPTGAMHVPNIENPMNAAMSAAQASQQVKQVQAATNLTKSQQKQVMANTRIAEANAAFETAWKNKMLKNEAAMNAYIWKQATGDGIASSAGGALKLFQNLRKHLKKQPVRNSEGHVIFRPYNIK